MSYRLFHSSPYDAETVKLMSQVFDEVCVELGLANREDRLRDMIAHAIMQCVSGGERDPMHVRQCARKALHLPQPRTG
jgi:hypothetical protein